MGLLYYSGKGGTQSFSEAVKWWLKAADQGSSDAQYNLGTCYLNGEGVAQSTSEAIKWFRKAAEQGDEDAIAQLNQILGNNKTTQH